MYMLSILHSTARLPRNLTENVVLNNSTYGRVLYTIKKLHIGGPQLARCFISSLFRIF